MIVKVDSTFKVGSRAKYALVYDESDYLSKVAAAHVDRLAICQPYLHLPALFHLVANSYSGKVLKPWDVTAAACHRHVANALPFDDNAAVA